ncbi:MAG: hypothetical protein N2999_04190 [Proteobacteria bacterium]|nr:hypothetical protein [Pseudomonadota bacterium]
MIIYWSYLLFIYKSKAEKIFGQVISLLNRREEYVREALGITSDSDDLKAVFSEIREILVHINNTKRNIYERFLKEHELSDKLEKISSLSDEKIIKINNLTEELHLKVNHYNNYVERINNLLRGKFSGIFFRIFNIPLAGKIEV